jgi:hypothetical protein
MSMSDVAIHPVPDVPAHVLPATDRFLVAATSLNLRLEPKVRPTNRIAVLPQGHPVRRLRGATQEGWWRVATSLQGTDVEGFVASSYLQPVNAPFGPAPARDITAVHLQENRPEVCRGAVGFRAFPIGEPERPRPDTVAPVRRAAALGEAIDWLAVDESVRYKRSGASTFCNVYAYDYCYLAGAYLPRVWWSGPAIRRLARSEPVIPRYGDTLVELNANGLFDWLHEFGPDFGWRRIFTADECQAAANEGMVGLICAQRVVLCDPGHIAVVAPETATHAAKRHNGTVALPLQSQAGTVNYRRYEGTLPWWTDHRYRQHAFWIHE